MRTDTARPQGISHTCFNGATLYYITPIPGWMVKNREQLAKLFPAFAKQKSIQQNTFKS